jgi:hypothetical protein
MYVNGYGYGQPCFWKMHVNADDQWLIFQRADYQRLSITFHPRQWHWPVHREYWLDKVKK